MKTTDNNLRCDIATGLCELPSDKNASDNKVVKLVYFTDPICSSCWGIEPQLRKLKLEYGDHFKIEYHMGGLLRNWQSYGGNDVNGPASVARHWEEAGKYYEMPIDGDIWREDPLQSSYPASIAVKAAQMQDELKGEKFLRRIREMVFVEKVNINLTDNLAKAAAETGLNVQQFLFDYANDAIRLFEDDINLTKMWGVRGFPTIFFTDEDGSRLKLYGSRNYEQYESALLSLVPDVPKKQLPDDEQLFDAFGTMAAKELAVIKNRKLSDVQQTLNEMSNRSFITKIGSNDKYLWKRAS